MSTSSRKNITDEPLPELHQRPHMPEALSDEDAWQPAPPPRDDEIDTNRPTRSNVKSSFKDNRTREGSQMAPDDDIPSRKETPTRDDELDAKPPARCTIKSDHKPKEGPQPAPAMEDTFKEVGDAASSVVCGVSLEYAKDEAGQGARVPPEPRLIDELCHKKKEPMLQLAPGLPAPPPEDIEKLHSAPRPVDVNEAIDGPDSRNLSPPNLVRQEMYQRPGAFHVPGRSSDGMQQDHMSIMLNEMQEYEEQGRDSQVQNASNPAIISAELVDPRQEDRIREQVREELQEQVREEFQASAAMAIMISPRKKRRRLLVALTLIVVAAAVCIPAALTQGNGDAPIPPDSTSDAPSLPEHWTQMGENIVGESARDRYGGHVAISNDGLTVAGGATEYKGVLRRAGAVHVYSFMNEEWLQIGDAIEGEAEGDNFGCSVSLNGNGTILAIGAYHHDPPGVECCNAGQVKVYRLEQDGWVQMGDVLSGEAMAGRFGGSVSMSDAGTILAVGAYKSNRQARNAGTVRVFEFANGNWTQIGAHIDGQSEGDQFGYSLSLSANGNLVAIGARHNSDSGKHAGKVRIFARTLTDQWEQVGQDILGEAEADQSSWSVALSGDASMLAVGAPRHNGTNGVNSGLVRAYSLSSNGNWTQIGSDIDGESAGDNFGQSVALSHDGVVLAAGARYNTDSDAAVDAGNVRVFSQAEGDWMQIGASITGVNRNDMSGKSIALSSNGTIMAIGAEGSNDSGEKSGHVRIFQLQQ